MHATGPKQGRLQMRRGGNLIEERRSDQPVALIVKRSAAVASVSATLLSSHLLRAG